MAESRALEQLIEVLRVDRRRHWLEGDRILTEAYFREHPELQANSTCALCLVYQEILLREELGQAPQLDEYLQRFRQLASQLRPLFEVHRTFESAPSGKRRSRHESRCSP